MEWSKRKYSEYSEYYTPWIEDKVLWWWYGDNKASYTAKDTMKTRVTDDKGVTALQDGVADGVGGQFAKGGLLGGVGEAVSKQGVNRMERNEPQKGVQNGSEQGKTWTQTLSGGMAGGEAGGDK